MAKPKSIILQSFCVVILLAGCVQTEIIDDVRLVTGISFDAGKGDKVVGTVLIPYYMPDQKIINNTLTVTGAPSRDLFTKYQEMSSDPVVGGSLEVVLFGTDFAKRGVYQVLDSLQRDPGIGTNIYLAVVDGNAQETLEGKYGKRGNSSFISELLEHNIKSRDLPKTNLHLFISDYYQTGKTAFLPIIKKKDPTSVQLSGIALMKDGRLVDKISRQDMFYFKLMIDKYRGGTVTVDLQRNKALIESLKTKSKKKLISRNPYEIDVNIEIKGYLHQYTGHQLSKKVLKEIERAAEKQIKTNCTRLFKQFQQQGIDPIGFGHFAKSRTRNFNYTHWKQTEYKNLKVNIKPSVSIIESGVIE